MNRPGSQSDSQTVVATTSTGFGALQLSAKTQERYLIFLTRTDVYGAAVFTKGHKIIKINTLEPNCGGINC